MTPLDQVRRRVERLQQVLEDTKDRLKKSREELGYAASYCSEVPSMSDTSRMRSTCDEIDRLINEVGLADARWRSAKQLLELLEGT